MKKYIDFHTHTIYSDGLDNPENLVRNARMKGIDVLAVTDHDNLAAYEEAKTEADKWGMQLIPGAEISTPVYHILALNIDPESEKFQEFLARSRNMQEETSRKRIEILAKHGMPITFDKLRQNFPRSRLGKYNVLMTMLLDEQCRQFIEGNHPEKSPYSLFKTYLREGPAANVDRSQNVSVEETIYQIHKAGGIAVIAHPFKEIKAMSELDKLVDQGIDGIEVQPYYGERNKPFIEYATQRGIPMTYGSDFHGVGNPRPLMDRRTAGNSIEEAALENLLNKWKGNALPKNWNAPLYPGGRSDDENHYPIPGHPLWVNN